MPDKNLDALASVMHDAAIRYANGHTVDFQHEAREFALSAEQLPNMQWGSLKSVDLDALEQKCDPAIALSNDEACYQRDILALIAYARSLEAENAELRTAIGTSVEYDMGYKAGEELSQMRGAAEPVAWMSRHDSYAVTTNPQAAACMDRLIPLYTAPAAQQAQGEATFDPIAGADSETTVDMPCPFCGGEGFLMQDGPHHWIECSRCFCETTRCQSPTGNDENAARRAIQLWEQRYGKSAQAVASQPGDSLMFAIRDSLKGISNCISDPMWAEHAEVSKHSLKKWHKVMHDAQAAFRDARSNGFKDCIDAIRGAIAFGQQNANVPPSGHWLAEFWEIGLKLSASPAGHDAPDALRWAGTVLQLYDDATMNSDYMIDANDAEGILNALAGYREKFVAAPNPEREVL